MRDQGRPKRGRTTPMSITDDKFSVRREICRCPEPQEAYLTPITRTHRYGNEGVRKRCWGSRVPQVRQGPRGRDRHQRLPIAFFFGWMHLLYHTVPNTRTNRGWKRTDNRSKRQKTTRVNGQRSRP